MKNLRNFILLALAAAAAVYGTVALKPSPKTVPQSGELVFPGLLEKLNDTASIDGASGGETYKLAVSDGQWVLPDKDSYRADSQSVRQLLLGVASLERVEPKTSNPALYEKLGLVDPSDAGSDARAFTVSDGSGAKLAELIIGDSKPSRGDPQLTEFYVRFPGDDQSWLVQGKLPSAKSAPDWIDKTILDIPAVRVRSVSVAHPDGETVTVSKADAADQTFTLEDVPEGAK